MKGYYLFAPTEPGVIGPGSGVERKVRAQCAALRQDVDCELVILPVYSGENDTFHRVWKRLPLTRAFRKWSYHGEFDDADFLYIRQVYHDDAFVRYLKTIKKSNPELRIIYEIPTYPYGEDVKLTLSNYMLVEKERHCRWKAAKYFDRIVTFYGQKSIWNVPCIPLRNGFDFSSVTLPERRQPTDTIHLISVATAAFWHGYDRVIEGLHQYYQNGGTQKIEYHFVGQELPEHRTLSDQYGLTDTVIHFYGRKSQNELIAVYQKCYLGIDVLGGHRMNYPVSSSLKSREYCAYGIPMITSSPIDFLPKDSPYQFLAPYDDSPVDMEAVVRFYHSVYDGKDCNEVAKEIRAYAEARCDMNITMKPVADWLLAEKS